MQEGDGVGMVRSWDGAGGVGDAMGTVRIWCLFRRSVTPSLHVSRYEFGSSDLLIIEPGIHVLLLLSMTRIGCPG